MGTEMQEIKNLSEVAVNDIVVVLYDNNDTEEHRVTEIDTPFVKLSNGRKYYINDATEMRNPFKPQRFSKVILLKDDVVERRGASQLVRTTMSEFVNSSGLHAFWTDPDFTTYQDVQSFIDLLQTKLNDITVSPELTESEVT
jgi:hypothetical protein